MYVWDSSGDLTKILPISEYQGNIYTGELEDFNIKNNGDLYQGSIWSYYNVDYVYSQILKSNIVNGIGNGVTTPTTIYSQVLYVDGSNTNINPDGSETNPFPTITEAIASLKATGFFYNRIQIAPGTYNENVSAQFDLILNKNSTGSGDVIINGSIIANRSRLYLNQLTINPPANEYAVTTFMGSLCINACVFNEPENYQKSNFIYADWTYEGLVVQYCTYNMQTSSSIIAPVYNNAYIYGSIAANTSSSNPDNTLTHGTYSYTFGNISEEGTTVALTDYAKNELAARKRIECVYSWYQYGRTVYEFSIPSGTSWTLRLNPIIFQNTDPYNLVVIKIELSRSDDNITAKQIAYNYDMNTNTFEKTTGYVNGSFLTLRSLGV